MKTLKKLGGWGLVGIAVVIVAACGSSIDKKKIEGAWKFEKVDGDTRLAVDAFRFKDGKFEPVYEGPRRFDCGTPYKLDGNKLKIDDNHAARCSYRGLEMDVTSVTDSELVVSLDGSKNHFKRVAERDLVEHPAPNTGHPSTSPITTPGTPLTTQPAPLTAPSKPLTAPATPVTHPTSGGNVPANPQIEKVKQLLVKGRVLEVRRRIDLPTNGVNFRLGVLVPHDGSRDAVDRVLNEIEHTVSAGPRNAEGEIVRANLTLEIGDLLILETDQSTQGLGTAIEYSNRIWVARVHSPDGTDKKMFVGLSFSGGYVPKREDVLPSPFNIPWPKVLDVDKITQTLGDYLKFK